ncbi:MAG: HPr family phosphocarrier protein [Planctomycetaceae bacterium]|nr:HPr family phosphocarrier protein [Planctomycetaceae bacterium]
MSVSMDDSALLSRSVTLQLEQGLHIRVCSLVVSLVTPFDGPVTIRHGEKRADANSMFDLLQLAAGPGAELTIEAQGDGAEAVVNKLAALFSGEVEY